MKHYAAVHRVTREVMWTQNPHALCEDWECHELPRKPTEFDDFDAAAKRLKPNKGRKDRAERSRRSIEQRVERLEDQLLAITAQLAKLSGAITNGG